MKLPFEDTKYSRGRYDTWLMPWIRKRIAHNMDVLGLFVGPRGSGKSYAAMELAYTCDATMTADRIMFGVTEFIDCVVDGKLKRGNATILDDAGVFMNSRDWQSVQNKAISVVAQSFRYKNLITLITVPKENYIDSQTRGLFNITFEATEQQGVFKVKIPRPNPIRRNDDWLTYPVTLVPNKGMRTRNVKIKTTHFDMPPKWLYESYEVKRNIEIQKKQREVQKLLHSLTDSREREKKDRRGVSQNSLKNLKQFRAEKPTETSPKQSPNQNQ